MKKTALLLTTALLFSSTANALEVQPYIGADYAYSWAHIKQGSHYADRFQAADLSVGAMVTSVVGLELSFRQTEQKKKNSVFGQTKAEYKAYGLDGVYYFSVLDSLHLLGSAGLAYYEFKSKVKSATFTHTDDSHYGLRAGLGLQYNIDSNWAARLMFKYHHIRSDSLKNIKDVTIGARYYF